MTDIVTNPTRPKAASVIGEPSFADAITRIRRDPALPENTRLQWVTALTRMAAFLDRPPETIPARLMAVRQAVSKLVAARCGVSLKTLATYRSALRAALVWFADMADVPGRGTPLHPVWCKLAGRIPDLRAKRLLSPLMRYCSWQNIAPEAVSDQVLDAFYAHRATTTFLDTGPVSRRELVRTWNRCQATCPAGRRSNSVSRPCSPRQTVPNGTPSRSRFGERSRPISRD